MSLLYAFKQSVLDLGRGEAKAKAKPLLVGEETLDRSASGLDRRASERNVMFWLLSDRAMFLVVGSDPDDHAFRIPYEAVSEMSLDYDDTSSFLPWYIRISILPDGPGVITSIPHGTNPGQPLAPPPPVPLDAEQRLMLARGEIIPLAGFVACPNRFRAALKRRMELAGTPLSVTGEEAAERPARHTKQKRAR